MLLFTYAVYPSEVEDQVQEAYLIVHFMHLGNWIIASLNQIIH